ncbi:MAG TPA: acyl-CoA dehydrogenase family protein [Chthonomonadaceae bacterium]|nr:acyl-CoA dehydrogenase family protein [Chthonomonadaceae bacterium]
MKGSVSVKPAESIASNRIGGVFLTGDTDPRRIFIPEEFTPEDILIGKTAEDFLRNAVMPAVERLEQGDHALMHRLMQQAGELGLLGADVPEVYGGLGLKQTTGALIAEKINPQQSFALTHEAHTVIGTFPLLYFGNHDQKSRYLPKLASGEWIGSFALSEANSGSDALGMQTRATLSQDGSHYLLNGVKMWITNTAFAQLFTVFAKVDGEKYTAFLVERDYPGVSFGKEEHKLGMHGTSTRRVILDNVPVPLENALEVGKGHYAALCALNLGRFKLEAGAVGGMKYLLSVCAGYAQQRKMFGKLLADFGLTKHKLAEMAARTFGLESMIYRLADDLDSVFAPIVPDAEDASTHYHRAAEEFAIECNIVKVIGSETYSWMADEAIQLHGGYGYTEEFPVARAWRDQRLLRIGEGANEIVRLAIVNTLLRRDKQGRLAIREAGLRATEALSRSEVPEPPMYEDPLDAMGAAANDTKQLGLFLLFQATEKLGEAFGDAQEVGAAIADVICAAYAQESVWLRCTKLRRLGGARADIALLAGQIITRDYAEEALRGARYALDAMPALDDVVDWRDEPFTGIAALLDRLDRWEGNPMLLRRDLAAHVLEKDGYPL